MLAHEHHSGELAGHVGHFYSNQAWMGGGGDGGDEGEAVDWGEQIWKQN